MLANDDDDDDCDCGGGDNSMGNSLDKTDITSSQSK
jgi:hypothetical protein